MQTLCTSQAFLTVNTKTTSSYVTERVYCSYLLASFKHVILTLVDSPSVRARVLRGATSPHLGSKAFLRVQNMMVGNFRKLSIVVRSVRNLRFIQIQFRGQSLYHGSRNKSRSRKGLTLKHLERLFYLNIRKVRPGPNGLVPRQRSSYCCREMPANSGSKRSKYFSRRVRIGL